MGLSEQQLQQMDADSGLSADTIQQMDIDAGIAPPTHNSNWMQSVVNPQQMEQWKSKGPIGTIEAFKRFDKWGILPYVGGLHEGAKDIGIIEKMRRASEGGELNPAEKKEVSDFIKDYSEVQARGYSLGGKMVDASLQSLPYMVEAGVAIGTMGLAGGATSAEIATEVGAKAALKATVKGVLAKSAALSAYALPSVTRNTGHRMLNEGLAVTDKGEIFIQEAQERPATTIFKALGESAIDLASEMYGGLVLRKMASPLFKGAGAVAGRALSEKTLAVLDKAAVAKGIRTASDYMRRADKFGFNGFLEEMGEELLADVAKTAFDLDAALGYSFEQFLDAATFDKEEFLITAGIIATQGGLSVGTLRAYDVLKKQGKSPKEMESMLSTMSETEKEALADNLGGADMTVPIIEEAPPGVEQEIAFPEEKTTLEGQVSVDVQQQSSEVDEDGYSDTPTVDAIESALQVERDKQQAKMDTVLQGGSTVNTKAIDSARKVELRGQIKSVDKELSALSKQYDEIFKRIGETTDEKQAASEQQRAEAISVKMGKLIDERDALELDRELVGKMVTTSKGEKVSMTREQASNLQKVDKSKRVLAALKQGFSSGQALTKASLDIAQKEYKSLVKMLPREERGKVAFDFTKFNNVESAVKNYEAFSEKVDTILEKSALSAYHSSIQQKLKQAKPTTMSDFKRNKSGRAFKTAEVGAEAGNRTADVQAALSGVLRLVKETKSGSVVDTEAAEKVLADAVSNLDNADLVATEIADAALGYANKDIDKTEKFLNILDTLLADRRTAAMEKVAQEKQYFEEILTAARESIQGDTPADFDVKQSRMDIMKKFVRTFGKTQESWTGLMDILCMHDKKSTLSTIADAFYPTRDEFAGLRKHTERFLEILKDKVPAFQNEREYAKRMQEDTKEQDFGEYIDTDGKVRKFIASKSEARKLWMEMQAAKQNEVLLLSLEQGNKYTFEYSAKDKSTETLINSILDSTDIAMAEAQLEFYDEYYDRVNEFHRARFGIDMNREKLYSPIRRRLGNDEAKGAYGDDFAFRISTTPGAMKARTASIKPLRLQSDLSVLCNHITEIEHGVAWDAFVKKANHIFNDIDVQDIIENKFGRNMLGIVKQQIQDFALGGQRVAEMHTGGLDILRRNYTKAALGFKAALAVKQATACLTFIDEVGFKDYARYTAEVFNPAKWSEIKTALDESEMLRARNINIDRDLAEIARLRKDGLISPNPKFDELMFAPVRLGDRAAIYFGGWSIYKKTLVETGSKEQALEAFERAFDSSQQSSNLYQLSAWQRGGSVQRLFTMFTSAQNMYFRKEIQALRSLVVGKKSMTDVARTLLVYHVLLPNFFQWVANLGRWDEGDQLRATILGSLNGAFIFGQIADTVVASSLYLAGMINSNELFDTNIPVFDSINSVYDAVKKIDPEYIEAEDVMKAAGIILADTVGPLVGLPIGTAGGIIEGASDMVAGKLEEGFFKTAGWSPYVVKKNLNTDDGSTYSGMFGK